MNGFSLLELVLVLAIAVTLAAIAAPRYGLALDRYHAEAAARRVAADLGVARATAMAQSASIAVIFDVPQNRYDIAGVQSLGTATDASLILSEEPYRSRLISADFDGDGAIFFDGHGAPDSGGTVVITCGTDTRSVVVDAQTGAARVP